MFFLLKMWHVQLNYALQLFWIVFGKYLLKSSLFNQKSDYLRKKLRNTQKFCISHNRFYWEQILRIFFDWNNPFCFNPRNRTNITKAVHLLKMSHIQLNSAFLLFWIIFGEKLLKTSLFSKKVIISERSWELIWRLVFLNNICYGQTVSNTFIWWKQLLFLNQIYMTNTVKNCLPPQNEPRTLNYAFQLIWPYLDKINWNLPIWSKL